MLLELTSYNHYKQYEKIQKHDACHFQLNKITVFTNRLGDLPTSIQYEQNSNERYNTRSVSFGIRVCTVKWVKRGGGVIATLRLLEGYMV